jgi:cell division protein FtsB
MAPKIGFYKKKKKRGGRKSRSNFSESIITIVLIFVSIFLLYQTGKSIYITSVKLQIVEDARQEVNKVRLDYLQSYVENSKIQTDDYVETESRNRLRYSKDGEVIFVIPENLVENESLDNYLNGVADLREGYYIQEEYRSTPFEDWRDFIIDALVS